MTVAGMADDFEQIVVRFTGTTGRCPAESALADDHRKWRRQPGEAPDAFESRVLATEPAARVIIFFPCDPSDTDQEARHEHHRHRGGTLRIAHRA